MLLKITLSKFLFFGIFFVMDIVYYFLKNKTVEMIRLILSYIIAIVTILNAKYIIVLPILPLLLGGFAMDDPSAESSDAIIVIIVSYLILVIMIYVAIRSFILAIKDLKSRLRK